MLYCCSRARSVCCFQSPSVPLADGVNGSLSLSPRTPKQEVINTHPTPPNNRDSSQHRRPLRQQFLRRQDLQLDRLELVRRARPIQRPHLVSRALRLDMESCSTKAPTDQPHLLAFHHPSPLTEAGRAGFRLQHDSQQLGWLLQLRCHVHLLMDLISNRVEELLCGCMLQQRPLSLVPLLLQPL
jgi:hypothetical protein